jgi:hypothetical protein
LCDNIIGRNVVPRKKEQDDEQTQIGIYHKANRAKLTALLNDPFIGDKVSALMKFLKTMGPASAPALVDYIENSQWLRKADADTRFTCLSYISTAIMRLRIQHGLPPFDDGLGPLLSGEPEDNAFMKIRKLLTGV